MGVLNDSIVFPILLSRDLEASRAFYAGRLGLEIARENPGDRIVFRTGGGTQIAVTLSTVGTADTQTQLAWRVLDIHAAVRRCHLKVSREKQADKRDVDAVLDEPAATKLADDAGCPSVAVVAVVAVVAIVAVVACHE